MEEEQVETYLKNKREWPSYLSNPDTRASHIAIILMTIILVIFAIIIISWTSYRVYSTNNTNFTNTNMNTLIRNGSKYIRDFDNAFSSLTSLDYQVLGTNQLVDPTAIGTRYLKNGQSIKSRDLKFELGFSFQGNVELWNLENNTKMYESFTINLESPGQRFLCGIDGYCYILRDDGTRIRKTNENKDFYQSPNQVCPYYRDKKTNVLASFKFPYILDFYEYGLCLWSNAASNSSVTGSNRNSRVNLWWVSTLPNNPPPSIGWTPTAGSFDCL